MHRRTASANGIGERQRSNERGIEDAEHAAARADTERESEDHGRGERRPPAEHAERKAKVVEHEQSEGTAGATRHSEGNCNFRNALRSSDRSRRNRVIVAEPDVASHVRTTSRPRDVMHRLDATLAPDDACRRPQRAKPRGCYRGRTECTASGTE